MGVRTETKIIWKCDRCHAEREGGEYKPSTSNDAWSYLKIDQDAGWDACGLPWTPRMRKPLLLCEVCTEEVIELINTCPGFEIEPGIHSGCNGSADCPVCKGKMNLINTSSL